MDAAMSPDSGGSGFISHDARANIPMLNVAVKKKNFMNAINFDTLAMNNGMSGGEGEYSLDSDGLEEQSLASEATSDLLERQQAREQTHLLDRFKQLREWQAQQQDQLMRQQEQQLAQFRSEQEKLQQLILRQRSAHWGSNPGSNPRSPQHNGVTSNGRHHKQTEKSSPHTKMQSQLPHAIAGSALLLARCQQDIIQQMATPTKTVKRPRRHSVSSLSTQEEFFECEDENATNNADCNNCNKLSPRTNGGDNRTTNNEPGRSRTTEQEGMSERSSHALRHSTNGPVRYTHGLSIVGVSPPPVENPGPVHYTHGLSIVSQSSLPVDNESRLNADNARGDSDDDSDGSGLTVDESGSITWHNGFMLRRSNEGMRVVPDHRGQAGTSEGTDNPTWMIHAVATQYVSPGAQRPSQHRYQNDLERDQRVPHTLRVADEGTNTENDNPMLRTASCVPIHDETSGSESDISTRRVLFPDAAAGRCDYSSNTRMPFHRPQFDNFSETGSYSPPRERRSDTKTVGLKGRESDDRVIFNTAVGSDDRRDDHCDERRDDRRDERLDERHDERRDERRDDRRDERRDERRDDRRDDHRDERHPRLMSAQWAPEEPRRNRTREERRGSAEESVWQPDQPLLPPKPSADEPRRNRTREERRGSAEESVWQPDQPLLPPKPSPDEPRRNRTREERRGSAEESVWQPDQPLSPPKVPDERPIRGTRKTFEQLLEEKLMTAAEQGDGGMDNVKGKRVRTEKNFLRRGSGRSRFCASKDKMRQQPRRAVEKPIRPMVAGLLGKSAKDDAETRLLGESAIIDGPNVRDLPSPPEPRVSITPPTVEKHPAPPKQPDRKKLSVSKPNSPKSMPLKPVPVRSLSMKINLSLKGVETDAMSESEVKVDGQGHGPIEPEGDEPRPSKIQKRLMEEMGGKMHWVKALASSIGPSSREDARLSHGAHAANVAEPAANMEFEQDELEEFELLEQFAEDDASFMSSVSAVDKVLQKKKATQGQPIENNVHAMIPTHISEEFHTAASSVSSLDKVHVKKSSTSGEYDNVSYFTQASAGSRNDGQPSPGKPGSSPGEPAPTKQVRKVARLDRRGGPSEKDKSVLYFGKPPIVQTTISTNTNGLIDDSMPPTSDYDTENQREFQASDVNFADDEKSWDTIYEKETAMQTSEPKLVSPGMSPRERRRLEKEPGVSPPPTSAIVTKLFPDLKAKKEPAKTVKKQEQEKKLEAAKQADVTAVSLQSKELRDRLLALESEIEQFRRENANLEKLRKQREEGLEHLKREMLEFEKQKAEEMAKLQEFKTEETKKLKRERKLFDQHQKVTRAMADKEQRDELDLLRQQTAELKEETKKKEQRATANAARLRERIESLELQNCELKAEIRLMEQKRLEEWQRRETAAATATAAMTAMTKHGGKKLESKESQATPVVELEPMTQPRRDTNLRLSGAAPDVQVTSDDTTEATPQVMQSSHRPSKCEHPTSEYSAAEPTAGVPRQVGGGPTIMPIVDANDKSYEEVVHPDGKVERIYSNNAREILFANGTRKQISSDGQSIIVWFFNGDIKQMMPDQRVVYYYADAKTTHSTYCDGLEILRFPTGQTEKHYPDGTREITFPDQTIKYLFPNGTEESIFADGTVIRIDKDGNKTMEFPNGQREVHTVDYKRREYPDGTTKTVFPNGRQETLYSSGRFRVKDKDGNVIVDKRVPTMDTGLG